MDSVSAETGTSIETVTVGNEQAGYYILSFSSGFFLSREATYFLMVCSLLPTRPEVKGIPRRILLCHFCDLITEIVMEYKLGEGLG